MPAPVRSIWIGFDTREGAAFAVAKHSAARHGRPIPTYGLELEQLRETGLYYRPTANRHGVMWDDISDAPMSTEFAISRFLTPRLAHHGWALFMDADVLIRRNLSHLFELADPSKAVMCVPHRHEVPGGSAKMDGQFQQAYARKNWSSVMLFNCDHPANQRLTVELVNVMPGRDLHRFCWLEDHEIGFLPPEWNWLVGVSPEVDDPAIVHFTLGIPTMRGYEGQPYADEWRSCLRSWARSDVWPASVR